MKPDKRLGLAMRREILQCLRQTQQMDKASRLLGLGRQTLYNKVKALRIVRSDWRGVEPEAEFDSVAPTLPLLLKELADLLARYSSDGAVAPQLDPLVLGEFHVPANGFPTQLSGAFKCPSQQAKPSPAPPPCSAIAAESQRLMGMARSQPHRGSSIVGHEPTIDLFLRLGIDLRRKNLAKRRHGFWRRFEGELDYLLVDARAAFVEKIKVAHPDRGGSSEEAASLTLAWDVIRRRFARRGITL